MGLSRSGMMSEIERSNKPMSVGGREVGGWVKAVNISNIKEDEQIDKKR